MEFTNAPVAEVIVGLHFDGRVFDVPKIFEFYDEVKSIFPNIEEQPLLPIIVEKPGEPSENRLLSGFDSRKHFINNEGNKLIQIQPDRLLFNWRKTNNQNQYPHFRNVLGEFNSVFEKLSKTCMIIPTPIQAEVTYVDHILIESFGLDYFDITKIFNFLTFNEKLHEVNLGTSYSLHSLGANVKLSLKSARLLTSKKRILVLETTVRGMSENMNLENWYKEAHKELLKLFDNITTDKAKEVWGIIK